MENILSFFKNKCNLKKYVFYVGSIRAINGPNPDIAYSFN